MHGINWAIVDHMDIRYLGSGIDLSRAQTLGCRADVKAGQRQYEKNAEQDNQAGSFHSEPAQSPIKHKLKYSKELLERLVVTDIQVTESLLLTIEIKFDIPNRTIAVFF